MKITEVIYKKEYTMWTINNSPYNDVYTLIEGDLINEGGISMGESYTLKQILEFEFDRLEISNYELYR